MRWTKALASTVRNVVLSRFSGVAGSECRGVHPAEERCQEAKDVTTPFEPVDIVAYLLMRREFEQMWFSELAPVLLAQVSNNQEKHNEAIRSAQQTEMVGYILAGVGILLVVTAISVGYYLDWRKKARKRRTQQLPATGQSLNTEEPQA
jgi:hypothetical protein